MNDTTPPAGEHAPSDEDLRFRLERGDGLCLKEHTVYRDEEDAFLFWITCGDTTLERREFHPTAFYGGSEPVQPWMALVMETHRARVAEGIVGQQLAELDKWRSIAADLAEAIESNHAPYSIHQPGCLSCAALARYREAAG